MRENLQILGAIHDTILLLGGAIYTISKLKDRRAINNIIEKIRFKEKIESKKETIIVHSSSLGETKNALLFTKYLKEKFSELKSGSALTLDIKNTVFTDTAKRLYADSTYLLPFPFFNILKRFLPQKLKIVIFYEGDLWPAYIIAAKEKGSKILVVSGNISQRSAEIIRRTPLKNIISKIDSVFASSEEYAERYKKIGIKRVFNSKDLKNLIFLENNKEKSKGETGIKSRIKRKMRKSIIGISTRGNEEIEFLLETQKLLDENYILFIAPRHNFDVAENFLKTKNIKFEKFSDKVKIKNDISQTDVEKIMLGLLETNKKLVLIDTYGIVDKILEYFSFAFVGGSIVPIGGHNVLEPIARGLPVATGKHIWNIPEKEELIREKVLFIVDTPHDFAGIIKNSGNKDKEMVKRFVNKKKEEISAELERIFSEIERLINE